MPSDWCYVNDLDAPHRPKALRLSPGRGPEMPRRASSGRGFRHPRRRTRGP
ncbi:MAG: AAA family ATPase [Thioalkalivibrio sp.]|nr:AAA family ATPase [Thioalkalivibrio sp.]